MSQEREIQQRTALLQRKYGMLPATKEEIEKFNATTTDWYRYCKACGKKITGTREQVLKACACNG